VTDASARVAHAVDGRTLFADESTGERGSEGPFHRVYAAADPEADRWGYRCGACGSFDVAVDTMGRLACSGCPNRRKPDGWDAAHE
jgi:hypothetical protein